MNELPFLSSPEGDGWVCMMDVADRHLHEVIKRVGSGHTVGDICL